MSVRLFTADSEYAIDLIAAVEKDFGIRYRQGVFDECNTVGELFDIVWEGLPQSITAGGKCPSLMTFHLLKAHMHQNDKTLKLRPVMALKDIKGFNYVRMQRDLRRDGWQMPSRRIDAMTWMFSIGLSLSVAALLIPLIGAWWTILLGIALLHGLGLALHKRLFIHGLPSEVTIGELATTVSYLNVKRLLSNGASFGRGTLWKRFLVIFGNDGPIVRESSFV